MAAQHRLVEKCHDGIDPPAGNPDPRDGGLGPLGMMHDDLNAEKSLYEAFDSLLRYACLFLKKARYGLLETMQFSFNGYLLDTDRRELWRGSKPIAVEPQVFDLLAYLVQHRDRVVTKDDLLEAVWGGRIVSGSALATRINAARRAVGDTGEAQHLIRTLPRKGVRFIAEVKEQNTSLDFVAFQRAAEFSEKPSIVVLPFQNLSDDSELEYFADGLVKEIITTLSRIRWLFVIARNSTFTYKGQAIDVKRVGRELGLRYVLEGSVRKGGNHLRITAQLIDAATGAHLWANRVDGSLHDALEVQERVASAVAGAIEAMLRAGERTSSLATGEPALEPCRMAERRQVTIMFCDLGGSTALAARLDPEDLHMELGAFHAAVAEEVGHFGGYVVKSMGGGVLVCFGYPKAHEDDAERAVRAGLALVERVGQLEVASEPLTIRIGIATGLVVVGDLAGVGGAGARGRRRSVQPRWSPAGDRQTGRDIARPADPTACRRHIRLIRARPSRSATDRRAGSGVAGITAEPGGKPFRGIARIGTDPVGWPAGRN